MGPFVPDLISEELNLVFGFLIGIAFGFVLEQAGFSSSRKLTGLFYGRDFTVLRVFFTAAITAMSGILLLAYFGLLDLDIIYINPTYLWAAIIGGVIMGVGFIVGGYCPGTSICGVAIGKIDAMIFVLGGVLGVLIFGEIFPLVEGIYNGAFLGDITVPATLGISPGRFALMMIVVAVLAFIVTTRIERRVNPSSASKVFPVRYHRIAAGALILVGVLLVFLPNRKTSLLAMAAEEESVNARCVHNMTPDELAFRLLDRDPRLIVIDLRDAADFAKMTLPGAINISIDEMFGKQWREVLNSSKTKVFIAEDELTERRACVLAQALGYKSFHFLRGGLGEFRNEILNVSVPQRELSRDEVDTYRFRARASVQLAEMIRQQAAGPKKVSKTVKKVSGGCGA